MLETTDKKIDQIKRTQTQNIAVDTVKAERRVRIENALKKPQHAWIRDIDNSYNVFVPRLTEKVNYCGVSGALQPEIVAM